MSSGIQVPENVGDLSRELLETSPIHVSHVCNGKWSLIGFPEFPSEIGRSRVRDFEYIRYLPIDEPPSPLIFRIEVCA